MVKRLTALSGSRDQDLQVLLELGLPNELSERPRPQGVINSIVGLGDGIHGPLGIDLHIFIITPGSEMTCVASTRKRDYNPLVVGAWRSRLALAWVRGRVKSSRPDQQSLKVSRPLGTFIPLETQPEANHQSTNRTIISFRRRLTLLSCAAVIRFHSQVRMLSGAAVWVWWRLPAG
jgi:hypothetical protein